MNIRLVANIISVLIALTGSAILLSAFVGFLMGDNYQTLFIFSLSSIVTILFGGCIFLRTKQKNINVGFRDGFGVVALGWLTVGIFGAIPFYFSLPEFTFSDAFFEMMSGITTTGASVIIDVERIPYSVNFWRHLSNWIGGMGVVLLSLAILPMLGIGGMQLYKAEVPDPTFNNQLTSRIANTAKLLWVVYLLLSICLAIILKLLGMNWFDSICHTMSTMATGGFSTKNASLGHFSPSIQYVVVFFMILAGTNFVLHIRALQGRFKSYFLDEECRVYFLIIAITTLIITLCLFYGMAYDVEHAFRSAIFQVVSILTTTGFGNDNFSIWGTLSVSLILVLYFIGGSGGSTSGGMKIARILYLFKNAKEELKKTLLPHYVANIKVDKIRVKKTTIEHLSTFFFLYLAFFVLVTLIMSTVSGIDLETAFSSSIACLGNIGPGIGAVNQSSNYAFFPPYAKIVLAFAMVVGRLEVYTIMVLFIPHFWKKN